MRTDMFGRLKLIMTEDFRDGGDAKPELKYLEVISGASRILLDKHPQDFFKPIMHRPLSLSINMTGHFK
jgi:hypothetical protein